MKIKLLTPTAKLPTRATRLPMVTVNCCVCNAGGIAIKQSRLRKLKHGATCSRACLVALFEQTRSGTNNPMFGRRAEHSPHFKNEITFKNGYAYGMAPWHPFARGGIRYLLHRLVIESCPSLFSDESMFRNVNGYRVLSLSYDVHHKNENKLDNRPENLMPILKGNHTTIHNTGSKSDGHRFYPSPSCTIQKFVLHGIEIAPVPALDTHIKSSYEEELMLSRNSRFRTAQRGTGGFGSTGK